MEKLLLGFLVATLLCHTATSSEVQLLDGAPDQAGAVDAAGAAAKKALLQDAERHQLMKETNRAYKQAFGKDVDLSGEDKMAWSRSRKAVEAVRSMRKAYEAFRGKIKVAKKKVGTDVAKVFPKRPSLSGQIHSTIRSMWKDEKKMLGGHNRRMRKVPHAPRTLKDVLGFLHTAHAQYKYAWKGIPPPSKAKKKLKGKKKSRPGSGKALATTGKARRDAKVRDTKAHIKMRMKKRKDRATKDKVAAKRIKDKRLVNPELLEVGETLGKAAKAMAKHAKKLVHSVKVKKLKKAKWHKTPKALHEGKKNVNSSAAVIQKAMERMQKAKAAGVHNLPPIKQPAPKPKPKKAKKANKPAPKPKKAAAKPPPPKPKNIKKPKKAVKKQVVVKKPKVAIPQSYHRRLDRVERGIKELGHKKKELQQKKKRRPKKVKKPAKPVKKPVKQKKKKPHSACRQAVQCKKGGTGCLASRANELQCKATETRKAAYRKQINAAVVSTTAKTRKSAPQISADWTAEREKVAAAFMQGEADRARAKWRFAEMKHRKKLKAHIVRQKKMKHKRKMKARKKAKARKAKSAKKAAKTAKRVAKSAIKMAAKRAKIAAKRAKRATKRAEHPKKKHSKKKHS